MDGANGGPTPDRRSIIIAAALALAVAAAVLITAVLPAQFGFDPVGTGRASGLLDLYNARATTGPPITPPSGGPLFPQTITFRADSRQLVVPSLGSIEFKYQLRKGAPMMYSWQATAPVDFDFHTEVEGTPNASDTFQRGEAIEASGSYTAPYDGIHGWYWENLNDTDVTITLDAAGFFSEARLFLPNQSPQRIVINQESGS